MKMENQASSNTTQPRYCVDLRIYGANKTFCDVSSPWIPRVSKMGGIFTFVLPTLFATVVTMFLIRREQTKRYVKENKEIKQQEGFCGSKKLAGWTFVGFLYGKLVWDVVDVGLDAFLFYQLEVGNIIDNNVTRNPNVTNAILAFAILGALKMLVFFFLIKEGKLHSTVSISLTMLSFFFEDGPELILEYFYIDKYVSVQPPWYLLVRDAIIAGITFFLFVDVLNYVVAKYRGATSVTNFATSAKCRLFIGYLIATAIPLMMTLVMFIRIPAAAYQYVTGKLKRGCFLVQSDGFSIQTPFTRECLREVDYVIISFFFAIPVLAIILFVFRKVVNLCYQEYEYNQFIKDIKTYGMDYGSRKNPIFQEFPRKGIDTEPKITIEI